jgi:predicted transcriptional regulator of viral defense system
MRLVAALATRQHGVVASRQLQDLGLNRHAIQRLVTAGWLHPIHRGVYAVGHRALTMRGRYMAAVLAGGPRAALSHRAAAGLWGLRRNTTRVEITVAREAHPRSGIEVHRSRVLDPSDVTTREGIRVTTVARTLLDLASVLRAQDLARAVDRAERAALFDLAAVDDMLSRARGRHGTAALRRAVTAWRPSQTRSELEDRFRELLEPTSLPSPLFNALVEGERGTHEVDALWSEHGLVVQLDGFEYHRTRQDRQRDADTDADLELAGFHILHLTWADVTMHAVRTLRRIERLLQGAPAPPQAAAATRRLASARRWPTS